MLTTTKPTASTRTILVDIGRFTSVAAMVAACQSEIGSPAAPAVGATAELPGGGVASGVSGSSGAPGSVAGGDLGAVAGAGAVPSTPGTPSGGGVVAGVGGAQGSGGVTAGVPAFEPAPALLRRLTRTQFRNAVSDLLQIDVDVTELDADIWTGDFATVGAATVVTSERGVEQYHSAIEGAVDIVFADDTRRAELLGCVPSGSVADACLQSFVQTLGQTAWRRPLDPSELARLVALGESASAELSDPYAGPHWAAVALLTSPHFLYRAELGSPLPDGSLRLLRYEMASRLAFLVRNSIPDQALLDEAGAGLLDTSTGVRAAAERLLDAPRGREAIGAFAEEYLRLDRVQNQAKDVALFPEYGPSLQTAMVRDVRSAWESIAFDTRASALQLFTTTTVFVNSELAVLYGLDPTGLDAQTFEERSLPPDGPRVGILGKAGFLSQFANQKEGSPTLRGKFLRQALMCTPIPSPPGNIDVVLDEPPADMPQTKRQRLEAHRENDTCAGCHGLMDPLGLPFESFDAIGRYRTTELGLPIDPSGEFDGQSVANARELGAAIASSDAVAQCLVRKFYTYALGFEGRRVDEGTISELHAAFQASGYQLRDLVLDVVAHEAFATVAPAPEAASP